MKTKKTSSIQSLIPHIPALSDTWTPEALQSLDPSRYQLLVTSHLLQDHLFCCCFYDLSSLLQQKRTPQLVFFFDRSDCQGHLLVFDPKISNFCSSRSLSTACKNLNSTYPSFHNDHNFQYMAESCYWEHENLFHQVFQDYPPMDNPLHFLQSFILLLNKLEHYSHDERQVILAPLNEIPSDFHTWCQSHFNEGFLTRKKTAKPTVYECPLCHQTFTLNNTKTIESAVCPHCNAPLHLLSQKERKTTSRDLQHSFWILQKTRIPSFFVLRQFQWMRSASNNTLSSWENLRIYFNQSDQPFLPVHLISHQHPFEFYNFSLSPLKILNYSFCMSAKEMFRLQYNGTLWTGNWNEVTSDSSLRFLHPSFTEPIDYQFSWFLSDFRPYTFMEHLCKQNFASLALHLYYTISSGSAESASLSFLQLNETRADRILNIPAQTFKRFLPQIRQTLTSGDWMSYLSLWHALCTIPYGPQCITLLHQLYPDQKENGISIPQYPALISELLQIPELSQYHSLHRLYHLLQKLLQPSKQDPSLLHLYIDYLRMGRQIELDFTKKEILCPSDIQRDHDICVEQLRIKENEQQNAILHQLYEACKPMEYNNESFILRFPASCNDFAVEGAQLKHCVSSYIPRVCEKRSLIAFVRRIDTPNTPLYTMELNNWEIKQFRSYKNHDVPNDARTFVDHWYKEKIEPLKKQYPMFDGQYHYFNHKCAALPDHPL